MQTVAREEWRSTLWTLACVLGVFCTACFPEYDFSSLRDADARDADAADADSRDAGSTDADEMDTEAADAESFDADTTDTDAPDADSPDADSFDADPADADPDVECSDDDECTESEAARCHDGQCLPCSRDRHCESVDGLPFCRNESCVECVNDDGCEPLESCSAETNACECRHEACGEGCCEEGVACVGGACCTPSCEGRECGPDGCGGTCAPGCHPEEFTCLEGIGHCMRGLWRVIEPGEFEMGSHRDGEEPSHTVTLTRPFVMLSNEVTQADFEALMGYNPAAFSLDNEDSLGDGIPRPCGDDCPVETVNWHEAAFYCNELSASEAVPLEPCYRCDSTGESGPVCTLNDDLPSPYDCEGYRLPTEAEWEFSARAGTLTDTHNGDLDVEGDACEESVVLEGISWYCSNTRRDRRTRPVGRLGHNDWELYDMLGNVYEWCHDTFAPDITGLRLDPWVSGGGFCVVRGGGWTSYPTTLRAWFRDRIPRDRRQVDVGFRPARTVDPAGAL